MDSVPFIREAVASNKSEGPTSVSSATREDATRSPGSWVDLDNSHSIGRLRLSFRPTKTP